MGNKKQNTILYNVEITDIGSEGKSIAKIAWHQSHLTKEENEKKGKLIIFVKGGIPGDVADLEIFRRKKNFAEAKILKIHRFSNLRNKPFCSHFGSCGGCVWQNLIYEKQLFYKQKQVHEALEHIGGIDLSSQKENNETLFFPIIPSVNQTYYRNKLDFAFSNKRWLTQMEIQNSEIRMDKPALGFHISGLFDKVLDIEHCYLQPGLSNEIRLSIKDFALQNNYSFFDFRKQEGLMRNLIIRNSVFGELMVIVIFGGPVKGIPEVSEKKNNKDPNQLNKWVGFEEGYSEAEGEKIFNLLLFISEKFPTITSLMYIFNSKKNDSIFDLNCHLFTGRNFIYEKLDDLLFKISPKSFFQTNSNQALELYKIAFDFAAIKNSDIVYDLYTGTGTIANFVARQAKKVIGIETIPQAIEDAKENSRINQITNTGFFCGDIRDILNDDFIISHGKPEVIITDPPRAGMEEKVLKKILEISPQRIVYISCNPATQARDVAILKSQYKLTKTQPVDMFPHTHHVENVVLLEKR